mmetsp:Transcript_23483/g.69188  ORF Transcript_23483/g.69188 Transcript_23483/m.69188 type:complete len:153 (+) Transcript_23483:6-464(+)
MCWDFLLLACLGGGVAALCLPEALQRAVQTWGIPAWCTLAAVALAVRHWHSSIPSLHMGRAGGQAAPPPQARDDALAEARRKQQEKLAADAAQAQLQAEEKKRQKKSQQLKEAEAARLGALRRNAPPRDSGYSPLANVAGLPSYRPSTRGGG